MALAELIAGMGLTETVLDKVLGKRGIKITKKISAVTLMQRAINNTEAYLTKTKHDYSPNEILSNFWNDAFASMISIDKDLAWKLNDKSRFWSNPQPWIDNDGAMELIPTLKELNEKCRQLLVELDNRK